ncbi:hypothetical protein [Amycolatopsis pigmentata]|uniref:Uncharacterized protein n=1 Tax=Amycolatopsis pigmentata TaxID=450801 RepID=A0ABW5G7J4_9PSEU
MLEKIGAKVTQKIAEFREDWAAAQDALDRAEKRRKRREARQSAPSDDDTAIHNTATIAANDVPPHHGGHCHH